MFIKLTRKALKAGLVKTGQVLVYAAGDDGDHQKGLPKLGSRFVDNGNGTISDRVTGLMWVKDPSEINDSVWGYSGSPNRMGWQDAINNCEGLVWGGYDDWRLPNIKEMFSTVDHGLSYPSIDTALFSNAQVDAYWTSTTINSYADYAFAIGFYDGDCWWGWKPGEQYFVRPVRGGR